MRHIARKVVAPVVVKTGAVRTEKGVTKDVKMKKAVTAMRKIMLLMRRVMTLQGRTELVVGVAVPTGVAGRLAWEKKEAGGGAGRGERFP